MNLQRVKIIDRYFPAGIPQLWCPPLTHYRPDGKVDEERMKAHLQFMSRWVKGFLVPGTTGDGWELTAEETRRVISIVLEVVKGSDVRVLLGALHPDAEATRNIIRDHLVRAREQSGHDDEAEVLNAMNVGGFAVCPPRGEEWSQQAMGDELRATLDLGVPLALYQLPQFTKNEMSPALVADLAAQYPHFILFKDTSGSDRVAMAGLDYQGVFLTRGMEGGYDRWLKAGGGAYDAFLLSTANSFGEQLTEIRNRLEADDREGAEILSSRLGKVVEGLFEIVAPVQGGNPFANANKLADHFHALGPGAHEHAPPRLHSGPGLTPDMIRAAGAVLKQYDLMPARGYLETPL